MYSSIIAFFSNETSVAASIASFNFPDSASSQFSILLIDLLPDLSVGFTMIGIEKSFIFAISSSLAPATSANFGTDTPFTKNAFLISYLFVDNLVHSRLFPTSPNLSAK